MCDICRNNPCAPTCPNAEPKLYCERCGGMIMKGGTFFSAIDYSYCRAPFCSEDCLKEYFDIEEDEA